MKITDGVWIKIFQSGAAGGAKQVSSFELNQIIANFNSEDQVPIIIGTPSHDAPAYGWLSALRKSGDALYGRIGHMCDSLQSSLELKGHGSITARIAATVSGPKLLSVAFSDTSPLGASAKQIFSIGSLPEYVVQVSFSEGGESELSVDLLANLAGKV
ncbi:hypothetical protein [Desulfofustis glycolicus]|nr:hypothetical protein [Desulfofustis glycolicus]